MANFNLKLTEINGITEQDNNPANDQGIRIIENKLNLSTTAGATAYTVLGYLTVKNGGTESYLNVAGLQWNPSGNGSDKGRYSLVWDVSQSRYEVRATLNFGEHWDAERSQSAPGGGFYTGVIAFSATGGGNTYYANFNFTNKDVNEAPFNVRLQSGADAGASERITISESIGANQVIAELAADDQEETKFVGADGHMTFEIESVMLGTTVINKDAFGVKKTYVADTDETDAVYELYVKTPSLLNVSAQSDFIVKVKVSDSGAMSGGASTPQFVTKDFTVRVNPVVETTVPPTPGLTSTTAQLAENNPNMTGTVANVLATATAAGATSYEFKTGNNTFAASHNGLTIDASGKIILTGTSGLNFEDGASRAVEVFAVNAQGRSATGTTFTLTLTDVNEAGTGLQVKDAAAGTKALTVAENKVADDDIGTIQTVGDPEGETAFQYAITGVTTGGVADANGYFKINQSTGLIEVAKALPNVATNTNYVLTITSKDKNGGAGHTTVTDTITVTVTPVAPTNAAPSITVTGGTSFDATDTGAAVNPFAGVTIGDNEDDNLAVTITFDKDDGVLVGTGVPQGVISGGNITYTFTGKKDALTTLLDNVGFDPTNSTANSGTVTTGFVIGVVDPSNQTPVTNSAIQVVTTITDKTPPNAAPTITVEGSTSFTATDIGPAVNPFAGVTIGDNEDDNLVVTITFDKDDGVLVGNSVPQGVINGGNIVYTFTGKKAALTTVLDNVAFNPTDSTANSGTVTTGFMIGVVDPSHQTPVTSNAIQVVTTITDKTAPNQAPTGLGLDNNKVLEATPNVVVGELTAEDTNAGDTFTFGIDPTTSLNGLFAVEKNDQTKRSYLKINGSLDYEAAGIGVEQGTGKRYYDIKLKVTDSGGLTYTKPDAVRIYVDPLDEGPANLRLNGATAINVKENTTFVGKLTAQDPEGDDFLYSLATSSDGLFVLGGANKDEIHIAQGRVLDFEAATSHQIKVVATDEGDHSTTEMITINVDDVNDTVVVVPPPVNAAPTGITLNGNTIRELSADGTFIGTLSTEDPNAGDTFAYSLVEDAFGTTTRFAIVNNQLVAKNGVWFDFEQAAVHNIQVKATDQAGASVIKTVSVNVTNVDPEKTKGSSLGERIHGGKKKDAIGGGLGNDTLSGGASNDKLTGGKGKDAFLFRDKFSSKKNLDTVLDYSTKDDTVAFEADLFKKNKVLTKAIKKATDAKPVKMKDKFFSIDQAKDADDFFVYDSAKRTLMYDADGSGAGAGVSIATFKQNKALKMFSHKEFIFV
jgi:hypothetical protein